MSPRAPKRVSVLAAIDVAVTPAVAAAREPAPIAIVIDVLRATSTIVTALENAAAAVIPVRTSEEAVALQRRLGREGTLLGGERNATLIEGFDLDNSPGSYTRDAVAGKTVIFTTTNGTRALVEAAKPRTEVLCGALINRGAVAAALAASDADEALLICAGSEGRTSFEDMLAAGAIVDVTRRHRRDLTLSDAARVALGLWEHHRNRITTALASGAHARRLIEAGFSADIAACARLDASACVPAYADGLIKALS